MKLSDIMIELLSYTKQVAKKISYYNAIIDFTNDSHWFNPFYQQPEVTVLWIENYDEKY